MTGANTPSSWQALGLVDKTEPTASNNVADSKSENLTQGVPSDKISVIKSLLVNSKLVDKDVPLIIPIKMPEKEFLLSLIDNLDVDEDTIYRAIVEHNLSLMDIKDPIMKAIKDRLK